MPRKGLGKGGGKKNYIGIIEAEEKKTQGVARSHQPGNRSNEQIKYYQRWRPA